MAKVKRSTLFVSLHTSMLENYRDNVSLAYADRYEKGVEDGIGFIARHPRACAPYEIMGGRQIRKWPTKNFPALIFFSIDANGDITLEFIYHQSQNIAARLPHDIK